MIVTVNWLTLLLGVVLPMLVQLVTANVANGGLKAIVLAVLAAIAGLVQALFDVGGDFTVVDWNTAFSAALTTFLLAVGLHFGLLKPVGITGKDNVIGRIVPQGVGGNPDYTEDRRAA